MILSSYHKTTKTYFFKRFYEILNRLEFNYEFRKKCSSY